MTSRKCWLLTNHYPIPPNSFRATHQNRPPSESRDVIDNSPLQSFSPQLRHTSSEAASNSSQLHPVAPGFFIGGAVLPTILSPEFFRSSVFGCLDPTQQQTLMQYLLGLPALQQLYAASLQQQQQQRVALLHDVTSADAQRHANHQMRNCNKMSGLEESKLNVLISKTKDIAVPEVTNKAESNKVVSEGCKVAFEGSKVESESSKMASESSEIASEGSKVAPEVNDEMTSSEEINCKTATELSRQMLSVTALSDFGRSMSSSSPTLLQSSSVSLPVLTSTVDGENDKIPAAEKSAEKKVVDENQNMRLFELSPGEKKMETDSPAADAKVTLRNEINLKLGLDRGSLERNQETEENEESIAASDSKLELSKLQSSYDVTETKAQPIVADNCANATRNDVSDRGKISPSYQNAQQDDSAKQHYPSHPRIKSETIQTQPSTNADRKLYSTIRVNHSPHFIENREVSEDTGRRNPADSNSSGASPGNGSVLWPYLALPSVHATLMVHCRFCYASFRSASDRNEQERYLCESAASAVRHLSAAGSLLPST